MGASLERNRQKKDQDAGLFLAHLVTLARHRSSPWMIHPLNQLISRFPIRLDAMRPYVQNAATRNSGNGARHVGAVAQTWVGLIAKQRRRTALADRCQFVNGSGLFPQVIHESHGVRAPIPARSILIADGLWAAQTAQVLVPHARGTHCRCQSSL